MFDTRKHIENAAKYRSAVERGYPEGLDAFAAHNQSNTDGSVAGLSCILKMHGR